MVTPNTAWAGTAVTAEAAVDVLRRRGLLKKIKVLSYYYSTGVHRGIKRGNILAAPSDQQALQARIAVDIMVRMLEKQGYFKHVAPRVVLINSGKLRGWDSSTTLAPRGFTADFLDPDLTSGERQYAHRHAESRRRWAALALLGGGAGALALEHLARYGLAVDPHRELGDRTVLGHGEGVALADRHVLGVAAVGVAPRGPETGAEVLVVAAGRLPVAHPRSIYLAAMRKASRRASQAGSFQVR